MTLEECIAELEEGTSSGEDVKNKILAAGCKLTTTGWRCETCPVSQYLTQKMGKLISVGVETCWGDFGSNSNIPLTPNVMAFIQEFDWNRL